MAFTEFYCDFTNGLNINAGDNKTLTTATNGDWGNLAANRYTALVGTPFSGVSVGDFASVYVDGATTAVYIARVTAVNAGGASLDLSTTAKSGTAPTNSAVSRSCTVGGVWKGPNAAESFPFGFITNAQTDASGNVPRVNMKNNALYAVTSNVSSSVVGPLRFEGYTSSAGDGGRAEINCATVGASINMLTISGKLNALVNIIVSNSAATSGTSSGFSISGTDCLLFGCVAHDIRATGFNITGARTILEECEGYLCNRSNTATTAAFQLGADTGKAIRCIAHDNSGSNSSGFTTSTGASTGAELIFCIADTNGAHGILVRNREGTYIQNCDLYNNVGDGIRITQTTTGGMVFIENCSFCNNAWGVNQTDSIAWTMLRNCGFGSGTAANSSGTSQTSSTWPMQIDGSVTYASNSTPWNAPSTGDFTITLAGAKAAGRNGWTETQASYTGTISYIDIGAAQHLDSGGGTTTYIYNIME